MAVLFMHWQPVIDENDDDDDHMLGLSGQNELMA